MPNDYGSALQEGLFQKRELEGIADRLYGVDTPERADFEARFAQLSALDLGQLVGLLKMVEELRAESHG